MGWQEELVADLQSQQALNDHYKQNINRLWEKFQHANTKILPEIRPELRNNNNCLYGLKGNISLKYNKIYLQINWGDDPPCIEYVPKTNKFIIQLGGDRETANYYYFDPNNIDLILKCCVTGENPFNHLNKIQGGYKEAFNISANNTSSASIWKKIFG